MQAFDNMFFINRAQAVEAKLAQERSDAELARKLHEEEQLLLSNPSTGKSAFDRMSGPRPSSSQPGSVASSSRTVPTKSEQKMEQKGRSLMNVPFYGPSGVKQETPKIKPETPSSSARMPSSYTMDEDSDIEIIDASSFRDNGRNSSQKVGSSKP